MVVRRFLSITFFVGIAFIDAAPLSFKENLERQQNCGQLSLPTPEGAIGGLSEYKNSADDAWLLTVRPKFSGVPFPNTTAFLISPRHVMTSAQVVLAYNRTWRMGGKNLENRCTPSDRAHGSNNEVPTQYLNTLEIWDPVKPLKLEIVKGRLFYLCNDYYYYVPLLLEISQTTRKYPCFIDEEFTATTHVGLWAHSYGIAWGQSMVHRQVQVYDDFSMFYVTSNSYKEGGDNRGGPLVHITKEGKPTVIGVKESQHPNYRDGALYHFNLGKFETEICDYTGVCWRYPTRSTPSEENQTKILITTPSETIVVTSRGKQTKRTTLNPDNFNEITTDEEKNVDHQIPPDRAMEELDKGSNDIFVSSEFNYANNRKFVLLEIMSFLFLFHIKLIS